MENADALIIITEWIQYINLNWKGIYKKMRKPARTFDTRSILDPKLIAISGLNIWSIGEEIIKDKLNIFLKL